MREHAKCIFAFMYLLPTRERHSEGHVSLIFFENQLKIKKEKEKNINFTNDFVERASETDAYLQSSKTLAIMIFCHIYY
jgi:predicted oxidoreductase (fatty acid repression mutant protein)